MRSLGGVPSKMLAWLGQALWVFLGPPALVGDRMGGGAGCPQQRAGSTAFLPSLLWVPSFKGWK